MSLFAIEEADSSPYIIESVSLLLYAKEADFFAVHRRSCPFWVAGSRSVIARPNETN